MREFMAQLLNYTLIFMVGSMGGWLIEFFYRRFVHKKWVNPGFLYGPYLPLYGFGLCIMHLVFSFTYVPNHSVWNIIVAILIAGTGATVLEYIAGLIFIKGMKIKLWDYSHQPGNIQGIICPLFSFFWFVICTGYFFLVDPFIIDLLKWFTKPEHITPMALILGLFYGVFFVDLGVSLKVADQIRKFAKTNKVIIALEDLRLNIKKSVPKFKFFTLLKSGEGVLSNLKNYIESGKKTTDKIDSEDPDKLENK